MFARRFLLPLALICMVALSGTSAAQMDEGAPADDRGNVSQQFYDNTYFAVGLNLSRFSGTGIGGRLSLPRGLTIQAATFVVTLGEYTHFNVGGEAQYAFLRNRSGRFYALLGMGYYHSTSSKEEKPGNRIQEPLTVGLGLGYEWFLTPHIAFNLGVGAITWFSNTNTVFPTPELGLYFYFK